jgi:lincosamide nucleotidyltransferase B/F
VVGLMRHARGERLAAMRMVQVYALDRVLELTAKSASSNPGASVDPFNPDRRIERRCPELLPSLGVWAGGHQGTVPAAKALLQWLRTHHTVPQPVADHIEALARASE